MTPYKNNWLVGELSDSGLTYRIPREHKVPTRINKPTIANAIEIAGFGIPTICLSGGVDSQVTVDAFMQAGVKFKVAILEFTDKLNIHDVDVAKAFCELMHVEYSTITVDPIKFFTTGQYYRYAVKYHNNSPQMCMQYYFYDQLDAEIIVCGGNGGMYDTINDTIIQLPSYSVDGYIRYGEIAKRTVIGNFLGYSQDSFYWIMQNTPKIEAVSDNTKFNSIIYANKLVGYERCGMRFIGQNIKFNGYEYIKQYFHNQYGVVDFFDQTFRYALADEIKYSNLVHCDFLSINN